MTRIAIRRTMRFSARSFHRYRSVAIRNAIPIPTRATMGYHHSALYKPLWKRYQLAFDKGETLLTQQLTQRLLLVDAMDPINRVHYAYQDRVFSETGQDTTVLFGFMKQLFALLSTRPFPFYCVVAFDPPGSNFREIVYPGYKGHRDDTPEEILQSIPMIQTALDLLGIKWLRVHGVEADDVIGTLAKRFAQESLRAYIISRDKDFLQLLGENVVQIRGPNRNGEFDYYTAESFSEEYGLDPKLWVDVLALQGDESDNIPGVRNVGVKRALRLVSTYGKLETIFDSVHELKEGAVKKALLAPTSKNNAFLSRELVTLATDLNLPPLRFPLEDARLKPPVDGGVGLENYFQKMIPEERMEDNLYFYLQRVSLETQNI